MILTSHKSSTQDKPADVSLIYTRTQLLEIQDRNCLLGGHLLQLHSNALLRKLSTINRKPTRRGSKGVKRRLTKLKVKQTGVNEVNLVRVPITVTKELSHHDLPSIFMTNCRSLNQHKCNELELVIKDYSPDIITLTETWLTNDKECTINFKGYNRFTVNRPIKIGGGCCILAKSTISAGILTKLETDRVSALWVKLTLSRHAIIIGCIYHPPAKTVAENQETLDYLTSTMASLLRKHPKAYYILCGDFNNLDLTAFVTNFRLKDLIGFPTRKEAFLDRIVTNITSYNPETTIKLPPLCSNDHCCVFVPQAAQRKNTYVYKTKRISKPSAKALVSQSLMNVNWTPILQESNLDNKVSKFYAIVFQILDSHCPVKQVRIREDDPKWETDVTRKIRRARNKAYKRNSPAYKYLDKLLRTMIQKNKKNHVDETINSLGHSSWWKALKNLTGNSKQTPPGYMIDGKWCTPEILAEELSVYFSSIGGESVATEGLRYETTHQLESISESLVHKLLKAIDTRKATHSEDYPAWLSKDNAESISIPVTDIINCIMQTKKFPQEWKKADI